MRGPDMASLSGTRVFPATLAYAVEFYPAVVLTFLTQSPIRTSLSITVGANKDGYQVVLIQDPSQNMVLSMLIDDFNILKGIADDMSSHLSIPKASPFLSDPREAILDRARSLIIVRFSGRGEF